MNKKIEKIIEGKEYKKEIKQIISTANKLIENKLIFQNKWDMEPTHAYVNYGTKINWLKIANNDDEYLFMKNRHSFMYTIAQAYFLTKNEKYAKAIIKQLNWWLIQRYDLNGLESKVNRCLDKGIRVSNWIKIFVLIQKSRYVSKNWMTKIYKVMKEHAVDMFQKYPVHHILSNHGLIQNQGLLDLRANYPKWKIWTKEMDKTLVSRIKKNIEIQILPDGIHWEQSPMYHVWALLSLISIHSNFKKLNWTLESNYTKQIESLVWGIIKFIKPNRNQPMQSDSDDSNLESVLQMATIQFNNPYFKYLCSNKLDLDILITKNLTDIERYWKIKRKKIPFNSVACEESGNYYLRSGYRAKDSYLSFRNGQYGSGHAHSDPNNISIFANGVDWISNTGRYTYKESKERLMFKSAKYHNTQVINDKGATREQSSWSFSSIATTVKSKCIITSKADYVSGLNLGFIRDKKILIPKREIFFVKPDYWLVNDIIHSSELNTLELNFHIDQNIKIKTLKNKIQLLFKKKEFNIYNLSHMNWMIEKGFISKKYNLMEESQILNFKKNLVNSSMVSTLFENKSKIQNIEKIQVFNSNNEVVHDDLMVAYKIVFNQLDYDVIYSLDKEIITGKKIYRINNYLFYGKKIILKYRNHKLIFKKIFKY